jgi:vitamin B12 transporter
MFPGHFKRCASALVLSCSTALAFADDTRMLEPVEVSGLRPVDLDRATASVSVLTQQDLAVRLAPNPADQLRAVPGIAVSRFGSLGGLTQIRMRGAEANHTLVLFDGIDVSDPVNGETDFGLLTALPSGRIEVLRGTGSSIHGSDAIGGVVAISSPNVAGLTGHAESGSFGTAHASLGWSGAGLGTAITGFRTDGVDTSGSGGEKDGSQALSGLLSAAFDPATDWSLSVIGLARRTRSQFDSDTNFDGLLDDVDRSTEAEQYLAGAGLSGRTGTIDHLLRASYNEISRENSADGVKTDESTGARTRVSWSPGIAGDAYTLSGLLEYRRETYERDDIRFGGLTSASEAFEALSAAAEYRVAAGPVDVSASIRHDNNRSRFKDATTWRLGAGYAIGAARARIRGSVATGIKNPTFVELFGFFPGSFLGNPDLKPEESLSWEIGWEQTFDRFSFSAAYFEADLKNEVFTAFNPDFTSTARNRAGRSERRGFEFAARWPVLDTLTLSGQATLLSSKDETGADEIRVPESTLSASLDWQVSEEGLRIGAALDFVGDQGDFDFGPFPARRVSLDAYTLASLTAEYPVTNRIALTLRGENLFDQTPSDVFGYRGPGAAAYIGLKLR